jgi:hypothetical protein
MRDYYKEVRVEILSLILQVDQSAEFERELQEHVDNNIFFKESKEKGYYKREKGIKILESKLRSNKNAKKRFNNRGYNKYLKLFVDFQTA